jgi:hypothetical protein
MKSKLTNFILNFLKVITVLEEMGERIVMALAHPRVSFYMSRLAKEIVLASVYTIFYSGVSAMQPISSSRGYTQHEFTLFSLCALRNVMADK